MKKILLIITLFAFSLAALSRPQEVLAAPKISGIQLTDGNTSSPPMTVITDNITPYTITVGFRVDDVNTTQDISSMDTVSAAINYGGENAGQYRGYVTWSSTDKWPSYQDHKTCTADARQGPVPTPGYAVVQPTWGNNYIHLDSCVVSVPARMLRPAFCQPVPWDPCPPQPQYLVKLTVRFTPAFTSPSDNDISANITRTDGATTNWVTAQTDFNVGSCPGTVSVMGQLNMTPPSGTQICASGGSCISPTSNAYTVPSLAYSNVTISAIPPPNWTVSPTFGSVTTTCVNNKNGPFFSFTQNTTCPSTVTVSGSTINAPNGSKICADGTTNCVTPQGNQYKDLTVTTNASHTIQAVSPTDWASIPSTPQTINVTCSKAAGPTFRFYQPSTCTGIGTNCNTCAGTGCNGSQNCTDSGCGIPMTQSCVPPGTTTSVTGGISNAPQAVRICDRNSSLCSSASMTNYTINFPANSSIKLYADTASPVTPVDFAMTVACSETPLTGPQFWFNSAAGIVNSLTGITPNDRSISEAGAPPGLRVVGTDTIPSSSQITYDSLQSNIFRNASVTPAQIETNCSAGSSYSPASGNYQFFCYDSGTNFDIALSSAITTGNKIKVVYPKSGAVTPVTASAKTIGSSSTKVIVFVPGNLTVGGDITLSTINDTSGIIFALKSAGAGNGGDLIVSPTVGRLDGVYLFPGSFTDGVSEIQLLGRGSLLGIGTANFNLQRTYFVPADPDASAEKWTFEPKYLDLFRTIIALPKYIWRELPPQ